MTFTATTRPTTPESSPLDTLKALVLRTRERVDFVTDQLAGASDDMNVPEWLIEFTASIKTMATEALAEHVPAAWTDVWSDEPVLTDDAYVYDDGSSVRGAFTTDGVVSPHFPRYDGSREEGLKRHQEAVAQIVASRLADGYPERGSYDPLLS